MVLSTTAIKIRRHGTREGFTILELLVVIAIIAMIASLAFIQFSTTRARARDAQREQEIKTLQSALTLYVTSKSSFPVYSGSITGSDPMSLALVEGGFIPSLPKDPFNTGIYIFSYDSSSGSTYELGYVLETDSIPGKAKGPQFASP